MKGNDSQTHLTATPEQARKLAQSLNEAADKVEQGKESLVHVREILEQASAKGPWRLVLSVSE